jgi:hypothetical protein
MRIDGEMPAASHCNIVQAFYFPFGHVDKHRIAIATMLFKMFCSVL